MKAEVPKTDIATFIRMTLLLQLKDLTTEEILDILTEVQDWFRYCAEDQP